MDFEGADSEVSVILRDIGDEALEEDMWSRSGVVGGIWHYVATCWQAVNGFASRRSIGHARMRRRR